MGEVNSKAQNVLLCGRRMIPIKFGNIHQPLKKPGGFGVKVQLSLRLIKHHTILAHDGVEV